MKERKKKGNYVEEIRATWQSNTKSMLEQVYEK